MATTAILLFDFHADTERTATLKNALCGVVSSLEEYAPGMLFIEYSISGRELIELAAKSQSQVASEILLNEIGAAYGMSGAEMSSGAKWFRDRVVASYLAQNGG